MQQITFFSKLHLTGNFAQLVCFLLHFSTLTQQLYLSKVNVIERSFENLIFFILGSQNNSQKYLLSKYAELLSIYIQSGGASPTLQSRTVTPSSSQQTIYPQSGYDALSSVIVNGDSNLVSNNIKSGTSIFGIIGNYTGSGYQVKRSFLSSSLGSFDTRIPSSITTIQGMFFIQLESSSSRNPCITSFCCPQSFTLADRTRFLFSLAYLTFDFSPYIATTQSTYGCSPAIHNGYWYLNMDGYGNGGFYGKTYLQIY